MLWRRVDLHMYVEPGAYFFPGQNVVVKYTRTGIVHHVMSKLYNVHAE